MQASETKQSMARQINQSANKRTMETDVFEKTTKNSGFDGMKFSNEDTPFNTYLVIYTR